MLVVIEEEKKVNKGSHGRWYFNLILAITYLNHITSEIFIAQSL